MPANWTGSNRSICAQLELAGEQVIHAFFVHHQHNEVNRLPTNLKSHTTSTHHKKCRRAPTLFCTAAGDTAPIAAAHYEAALEQGRHDRDALCRSQNFFWDALIGCALNLVEHGAGCLDARDSF